MLIVPEDVFQSIIEKLAKKLSEAPSKIMFLLETSMHFSPVDLGSARTIHTNSTMLTSCANRYVTLPPFASIKTEIFVPRGGKYFVNIRLLHTQGQLVMTIDKNRTYSTEYPLSESTYEWVWAKSGPVYISQGKHEISLNNGGNLNEYIDVIYFAEEEEPEKLVNRPVPVHLFFEKRRPSSFFVRINASSQSFLIFTETFFPGWTFRVGNTETKPMRAHYFLNAFFLNRIGNHDAVIQYMDTPIRFLSKIITTITFVSAVFLFMLPIFRRKVRERRS